MRNALITITRFSGADVPGDEYLQPHAVQLHVRPYFPPKRDPFRAFDDVVPGSGLPRRCGCGCGWVGPGGLRHPVTHPRAVDPRPHQIPHQHGERQAGQGDRDQRGELQLRHGRFAGLARPRELVEKRPVLAHAAQRALVVQRAAGSAVGDGVVRDRDTPRQRPAHAPLGKRARFERGARRAHSPRPRGGRDDVAVAIRRARGARQARGRRGEAERVRAVPAHFAHVADQH